MRTNSFITLWHLDEHSGAYIRYFYRARIFFEERLAKNGIKQHGYHNGSRATVRIPASEKPIVQMGDYIRPGKCTDLTPERVNDLRVTMITENYIGANPHIRLFCGRTSERS